MTLVYGAWYIIEDTRNKARHHDNEVRCRGLGSACTATRGPSLHMSCSLNSLKGDYMGYYIEDYYRGY